MVNLKEPSTLKVRLNQVRLNRDAKSIKVMVTGDWHISPIISENQAIFLQEAVTQAEPDVILLQGDIVDSPTELERETSLKKLLKELRICSQVAPTFLVLGSHDFITPREPRKVMKEFAIPRWKVLCKKCGVRLLIDEWAELDGIRFFGAFQDEKCSTFVDKNGKLIHKDNPVAFEEFIKKFDFSNISDDKINWFLSHAPLLTPGIIEACQKFDVMSFGHTHGGIIPRGMDEVFEKLNLHFGIISANKTLFPGKVRGAWEEDFETVIVVNPGMTGAQFCAPKIAQKFNFIKAAEVSLIEITGKTEE